MVLRRAAAEAVYNLSAGVHIPIFQGGKVKADVAQAESQLRQSRMQLEDLHSRVEFEIRSALLDVKTSDDQVAVAKQQIELAAQQLKEVAGPLCRWSFRKPGSGAGAGSRGGSE